MEKTSIIDYAIKSYLDELLASEIYRSLADSVSDERIKIKLVKASEMEEGHAEFWKKFLTKRGTKPTDQNINRWKLFLIKILFTLLGIGFVLRILERDEREAVETYSYILDNADLDDYERNSIRNILEDELLHEEEFLEEESRFKEFLDHIRDSVLGMSDGLVEILSVSAGLAGAYGNPLYVALGGLIVGIGGALSMGIGAYISVKSQNQVRIGTFYRMSSAAKYAATALIRRLSRSLRNRGFGEETLEKLSKDLEENRELLSKLAAEEEFGYREETIEDPLKSGFYTGLFYIIGSIFPLAPYFMMLKITFALPLSFLFAGILLAITGALIGLSASLSMREKALEMVIAGLGAATLTYLIGYLTSILIGIKVG
jgi:VIT1/CCC1 family predicted Fe2+/Mn2+ transporter